MGSRRTTEGTSTRGAISATSSSTCRGRGFASVEPALVHFANVGDELGLDSPRVQKQGSQATEQLVVRELGEPDVALHGPNVHLTQDRVGPIGGVRTEARRRTTRRRGVARGNRSVGRRVGQEVREDPTARAVPPRAHANVPPKAPESPRDRLQEMAGHNDSLVALFRELAQLTVLDEGSPNAFRVRAYENAVEVISSYPGDLGALSEKRAHGDRRHRAEHGQEDPRVLRGRDDREARGAAPEVPPGASWSSAASRAWAPRPCCGSRASSASPTSTICGPPWRASASGTIRGLGAKVEEKPPARDRPDGRNGQGEAKADRGGDAHRREFVAALQALPAVERAQYCGSLRRLRETVADVDIVAASREPASVREAFVTMPTVREVLGSGDTKTSVLTTTGLQVDLGSSIRNSSEPPASTSRDRKAHNIKLRQRALARGWLLNEYGLSHADTGEVIASETEEAIYGALHLPPIPAADARGPRRDRSRGRRRAPSARPPRGRARRSPRAHDPVRRRPEHARGDRGERGGEGLRVPRAHRPRGEPGHERREPGGAARPAPRDRRPPRPLPRDDAPPRVAS